jgi:hypothetical protein
MKHSLIKAVFCLTSIPTLFFLLSVATNGASTAGKLAGIGGILSGFVLIIGTTGVIEHSIEEEREKERRLEEERRRR